MFGRASKFALRLLSPIFVVIRTLLSGCFGVLRHTCLSLKAPRHPARHTRYLYVCSETNKHVMRECVLLINIIFHTNTYTHLYGCVLIVYKIYTLYAWKGSLREEGKFIMVKCFLTGTARKGECHEDSICIGQTTTFLYSAYLNRGPTGIQSIGNIIAPLKLI